jgi:hypothetical protein
VLPVLLPAAALPMYVAVALDTHSLACTACVLPLLLPAAALPMYVAVALDTH